MLDTSLDLLRQAERSGDIRYADQVIVLLEDGRAAHRYPQDGALYWTVLGMARHIRYEAVSDLDALRAAVTAFRTVLAGISQTDQRWAACASNLCNVLVDLFEATGTDAALTEAIALLRTARAVAGVDDPNRSALLANLGKALAALAKVDDDPAVLAEEIAVLQEGLAVPGSASDPVLLSNLGNALAQYALRTGTESAFAEAVAAYRNAIAGTPAGHPDHGVFMSNMGNALSNWFEVTSDINLLEEAITVHRIAADTSDDSDTARRLGNLATTLVRRHEHVRDPAALTEAVKILRLAVARTGPEHLGIGGLLTNLGTALSAWFALTGNPDDLAEAISTLRAALGAIADGRADRAAAESALGEALTRNFESTGVAADLDEAVRLSRSAVARTRDTDSALALRLGNLAGALMRRFEQVRHIASVDEAIETARRAVQLTAVGNPAFALRLSNLGNALTARYVHTGAQEDLDEAVAALRQATANSLVGHGDRVSRLSALGNALLRAHLATGGRELLTEATTALRSAVTEVASGDPNRAAYRSNLANTLRRRYELDGTDDDATEAAELCQLAADDVDADHPNRAAYQFNLGSTHRARFRRDGNPATARKAAIAFLAAARVRSAPTFVRATAAFNAGRIAADGALASLAAESFAEAVALLDRLAWTGLPRGDQEELLRRFSGVATDAAALALECGKPEHAVELVEGGRGVLLTQAINARSPYTVLHDAAPDLALRLARLRAELDRFDTSLLDTGGVSMAESAPHSIAERRMALAAEHDRVVAEIDARGLSEHLSPPKFESLQQAAANGPVVLINISRYRCDALIVTTSGVVPVRLKLTAEEVIQRTVTFVDAVDPTGTSARNEVVSDVLEWLFDKIAEPVLRKAGFVVAASADTAPRLWWCPTGVLAFLPLHAAGPRPERSRTDGPAVLDRVVSSYAPTLRALLHARERGEAGHGVPRTLVVSVAEAPEQARLPATTRETATVRRWLPNATVLAGAAATADAVFNAIPALDWLHLACHGQQDPTAPSDGYLSLYDERLTVRRLAKGHGTGGWLAVLTACETIRGGAELSDEVITVAAAVQLAGFRHVVGTLWASRDSISARFVDALYRDLVPNGRHADGAARGVHRALVALRDRYQIPAAWAPFAHLGP